MKFCIIIPMHDEEANVAEVIRQVNEALQADGLEAEIVIVDDGSQDNTLREIALARQRHHNISVESHGTNLGFGAAIRTALRVVSRRDYDFAIFMDADLTMHPRYIRSFYSRMEEGYDFVVGSRFIPGGGMKGVPWPRKIFSSLGRIVLSACFRLPISDYTQGFRAIRMDIIRRMNLTENGFAVLIQEISEATKHTRKFAEVPFTLTNRAGGTSKFSYSPRIFWDYLKYAARARTGANNH